MEHFFSKEVENHLAFKWRKMFSIGHLCHHWVMAYEAVAFPDSSAGVRLGNF